MFKIFPSCCCFASVFISRGLSLCIYRRTILQSCTLISRCISSTSLNSEKWKIAKPADWKLRRLKTNIPSDSDTSSNFDSVDDFPVNDSVLTKGVVIERRNDKVLVEVENIVKYSDNEVVNQLTRELNIESRKETRILCSQKPRMNEKFVVPGDQVFFHWFLKKEDIDDVDNGINSTITSSGLVTDVAQRRNLLQRPSATSSENKITMKAIASNIDQMIIVVSIQPFVPFEVIDRYLVSAHRYAINDIVIVVNKFDLPESESLLHELRHYSSPPLSIAVVPACATNQTSNSDGLRQLRDALKGKTSIFVGQSGVGKSSLINALIPSANIRTGELVRHASIGAHTTSNARLHHLPAEVEGVDAGSVIDCPGIREIGIWHLETEWIAAGFKDIAQFADQCKFRNCQHSAAEAKFCAVQKAVKDGRVNPLRLQTYGKILGVNV